MTIRVELEVEKGRKPSEQQNTPRTLSISLLGTFRVELCGKPVPRFYRKMQALLAYLAAHPDQPFRRETLAELLWPDLPADSARQNLRRALANLREVLADNDEDSPLFVASKDFIRLAPSESLWIDLNEFVSPPPSCLIARTEEHCTPCLNQMERMAELYRGEFLERFTLPDSQDFDDWVQMKREAYHRHALGLLERLTKCYEQLGDLGRALIHAQRYSQLEPWDEAGHRRIMRLYLKIGQANAALNQYRVCCQVLEKELGVAPGAELRSLYESIRRGIPAPEGTPSPPSPVLPKLASERRQVTVLYCELSSPQEADPEDIAEMLQEPQQTCIRTIERFGGRLTRVDGGGLLAYFGYPIARENAALQAGLAATQIQATLNAKYPHVAVRQGIHTGFIVTSDDPNLPDTVGITSGLAVRLRLVAEEGQIAVSAATYRLIQGYFHCEPLGTHRMRGLPRPVEVYRVVGPTGAFSRLAASPHPFTPLQGRESEIQQLLSLWHRAQQGEMSVVLISGEAGIGKSRLIQALKDRINDGTCLIHELCCLPQFQSSALHPVIELLLQLTGICPQEPAAVQIGRLERYLKQFPLPLEQAVPPLARLLGLSLGDRYPVQAARPREERDETYRILLRLIQARAAIQPVMVVLEDLHWADPSTLELVGHFLQQKSAGRVLLLLTARPEFRPQWSLEHIRLTPLGEHESAAIIRGVIGDGVLSDEWQERIVRLSDGVPLFLEEMTRMVLSSDPPVDGNGTGSIPIPATLHDLLMARLDSLGEARQTAQWGSVLGREFTHKILRAVIPFDKERLQADIERLAQSGLLFVRETAKGIVYQFKHALFQEAAYQSQLRRDRQLAHRRVAQVIQERFPEIIETQPELFAQHLTAAGEARRAIDYWLIAGQRAINRYANLEAIHHLTTGLELLATLPNFAGRERIELDLNLALGAASIAAKGYGSPEVVQAYGRALELSQHERDDRKLFEVLWGLWASSSTRSGYLESRRLGHRLLEIAQRTGEPTLEMRACHALGNVCTNLADYAAAREYLLRGIEIYCSQPDQPAKTIDVDPLVGNLSFLSWVLWLQGFPVQALEKSRQAVQEARRLSDPYSLGYALVFATMVHRFRREPEMAARLAGEIISLAQQHGLYLWLAAGTAYQGWAQATQGNPAGVITISEILELMRQSMDGAAVSFLALLADAQGHAGEFNAQLGTLAETLALVEKRDDRYFEAELFRMKGECLLAGASGEQIPEAEECFRKALEISRRQGARSLELRAAISWARLWRAQGRMQEAKALLAEVYDWFTEGFDTADLQEAGALLASLRE